MPWSAPADFHLAVDVSSNDFDWEAYKVSAGLSDSLAWEPRGIQINGAVADPTSAYCTVRGWLRGEGPQDVDDYVLTVGQAHPFRFTHIVSAGTDATGIKLLG